MSTNILHYNEDGANKQAQATLAFLQYFIGDGIETSWNSEYHCYDADIRVARWENCREQGYVVTLRSKDYKQQLNVAFFEHRNSDSICAIKWFQNTLNSPTIHTADFGEVYKDKYDTSHDVGYGEAAKMAEWVKNQLELFWTETTKTVDNND